MNERDRIDDKMEARINALLEGELEADEIAALKREAEDDIKLARAIVEAQALQAMFDELDIERAPASLRSKLKRIPKTESAARPRWLGMPRWVPLGAMAAVPLLVVAMVMMAPPPREDSTPGQAQYSEAQIIQARQDVITALAYLDRAGEHAGKLIESELAKELSNGVSDNVGRYIPFTNPSEQEEQS